MAWPDFSELSSGYGFLREFERRYTPGGRFPAAPDFITQSAEATAGYDVEVLSGTTPVFFQFKRSFVLTTRNATEIQVGHFTDLILGHPEKGLCIAELKPAKKGETKYAIRFAVGQVLEYRHFVAADAAMLVILGAKPNEAELDYLRAIGISCAWKIRQDTFEFSWH